MSNSPAFFLSARASAAERAEQHHQPARPEPCPSPHGARIHLVYPGNHMGDDAAELWRLLDARNEHPESLGEIDGEIWRRFGRTRAVLVLDMCGFSRLTHALRDHALPGDDPAAGDDRAARDRERGRPHRQDRGRQRVRDVRRRSAGAGRGARDSGQPGRRQHLPARGLGSARGHRHRLRAAAAHRRSRSVTVPR